MINIDREIKLTAFIKFFTYTVGSIIILTYAQNKASMEALAIAISVMLGNAYFRDVLYSKTELYKYNKLSIIAELAIIMYITFIEKSGAPILFFMVTISETVIAFELGFSLSVTAAVLLSQLTYLMAEKGVGDILQLVYELLAKYLISIVFTFIMSYLVRQQLLEKEKLRRTNGELGEAYKKLFDSASKAQQLSIEKERTRMAREIHDTLAHTLTTVVVQLEASKKLIDIEPQQAKEALEKAQEQTRAGLNDVRRSVKSLRPEALENNSFINALDNLINEASEQANIKIELERNLEEEMSFSSLVEISLYRVIQETITNAIRHGGASILSIDISQKDGRLLINMKDNGLGCTVLKKGFGLQGITERIDAIGGSVEFASSKGKGFTTNIWIPLGNESKSHGN